MKSFFATTIVDKEDKEFHIPQRVFEIGSLSEDIKRNIIGRKYVTEEGYQYLLKPNFLN